MEFQTLSKAVLEGSLRGHSWDMPPRVDEFGTCRWPSRKEVESLLVVS
jgi:hypothetical protein